MYQTILYPTDGSEGAEVALEHARKQAATYDATLHVLFVVDTTHEQIGVVGAEPEGKTADLVSESHHDESSGMMMEQHDKLAEMEAQGNDIVESVGELLSDSVPVTTAVRRGDPYRAILDYAEEVDADLLVMGTHGRTGVDRYLLGSVTEKVVRTADIPVLTARIDEQSA